MTLQSLGLPAAATAALAVLLGAILAVTGVSGIFALLLVPLLFLFAVAAARFPIAVMGATTAWLAFCPFTWGVQTGLSFRLFADEAPIFLYLAVFPFIYLFAARVWRRGFGVLYAALLVLVVALAVSFVSPASLVAYRNFVSTFLLGAMLLVVTSQEAANSNAEGIGRFVIWTTVGIAALSIVESIFQSNPFLENSPFAAAYITPELLRVIRGPHRPYVSFFHPSEAGTFMALGTPFVVRYWLRCRSWISALALCTVAAGLLLNQTRGVWLGLFIALVAVLASRRAWFSISASAAVLAAGAWIGYQAFRTTPFMIRLANPRNLYDRLETWKTSAGILLEHPLFGVGPGNFSRAYLDYVKDPAKVFTPDNMFVSTAAESGLVGLLAWTAFLAVALWSLRRIRIKLSDCGLTARASFVRCAELALISYIAIGCFADIQNWRKVTKYIFLLIGLGVAEHVAYAAPAPTSAQTGEELEAYVKT